MHRNATVSNYLYKTALPSAGGQSHGCATVFTHSNRCPSYKWGEGSNVEKFSKHTLKQIIRNLDKASEGLEETVTTTARILTQLGISEAKHNPWQLTYGSTAKRESKTAATS